MTIVQRKDEAIEQIDALFSDTTASEEEQVELLEQIESRARDSIDMLREQIRQRSV